MATAQPRFVLPHIPDNPDGWGPTTEPSKFNNVPYAPFNKSDKLGRCCDWTQQWNRQFQNRYGNRRDQAGQNINAVFNYHHQDEDDFHLVDTRTVQKPKFYGARGRGFGKGGRGGQYPGPYQGGRDDGKWQAQGQNRGSNKGNNYGNNWGRWNRPQQRIRDSSVDVKPDWTLIEEIPFQTLQKLTSEYDEPVDVKNCGVLDFYDDSYNRITAKAERRLEQHADKTFYNHITTSEDPVLRQLAQEEKAQVFATDTILCTLMATLRSVYSWDIIFTRIGNCLYLDKRDPLVFDLLTVNETAYDAPEDDKEAINAVFQLSQEASMINQNFTQQVLLRDKEQQYQFPNPNPFQMPGEELASTAYKYRKWDLTEEYSMVARCEVDGVMKAKDGSDQLMTIKALNEFDSKVTGMDWRKMLDSQRGAVLATELKNNSNKLAKWTAQAILAGTEQLKIGYVSRIHSKDPYNHVILGMTAQKPRDFASSINLNLNQSWGILKGIIDLAMKMPEGKYVLMKDPNKTILRLYQVPDDEFVEKEPENDIDGPADEVKEDSEEDD